MTTHLAYNRGYAIVAQDGLGRSVFSFPSRRWCEMKKPRTFSNKLTLAGATLFVWATLAGVAWAEVSVTVIDGTGGGGGGSKAYVVSYFIVILFVGLGLLTVCKPSRLRDRPKGEKYESVGIADMVISKREVPVISLGMRIDDVTKLLGKPKVARTGEEMFRDLAAAGKLSEDEAAKRYLIYEHSAGRYELVMLDKRVIRIKSQPQAEGS
jgi:hypothetical protein